METPDGPAQATIVAKHQKAVRPSGKKPPAKAGGYHFSKVLNMLSVDNLLFLCYFKILKLIGLK